MIKTLVHIRVPEDDSKVLDRLAGALFTRNDMAAMLLHAAIEAVRDNPDRLQFPPAFNIGEPPKGNELNDKPRGKK